MGDAVEVRLRNMCSNVTSHLHRSCTYLILIVFSFCGQRTFLSAFEKARRHGIVPDELETALHVYHYDQLEHSVLVQVSFIMIHDISLMLTGNICGLLLISALVS